MIGKLAWRRGVMSIVERATVGALRKKNTPINICNLENLLKNSRSGRN
jgi:hypothetical protein